MLKLERHTGQSLVICWDGPDDATDSELAAALCELRIEVVLGKGRQVSDHGNLRASVMVQAPNDGAGRMAIWRGEKLDNKGNQ